MRFGVRKPSIRGRISARTSWKRAVRHSMGIKAPRGMGVLTNPKKALYNRIYNRTTVSIDDLAKVKRSRGSSNFGAGFGSEFGEVVWAYLGAAVIMTGLLTWIGLPWKFSMALTGLGLIAVVVGEEALKGIIILAILAWFFLH